MYDARCPLGKLIWAARRNRPNADPRPPESQVTGGSSVFSCVASADKSSSLIGSTPSSVGRAPQAVRKVSTRSVQQASIAASGCSAQTLVVQTIGIPQPLISQ